MSPQSQTEPATVEAPSHYLMPDEAMRLQFRDVTVVDDEATGETILEIEVRGKRGVGYCKSTSGAVRPFERLVERNDPSPTDLIFPKSHRQLFNRILIEEGLKSDREGNRRTAYSLRHTYICLSEDKTQHCRCHCHWPPACCAFTMSIAVMRSVHPSGDPAPVTGQCRIA